MKQGPFNILITAKRLVKAALFSVPYFESRTGHGICPSFLTNESYLKSQNVPRLTILRQMENICPFFLPDGQAFSPFYPKS